MKNIYDKRFVYFEWDDCLKGKTVYVADSIYGLREHIKSGDKSYKTTVSKNDNKCPAIYPFINDENQCGWRFVYYDPLIEYKRAYAQGKKVQFFAMDMWIDCDFTCSWKEGFVYRIVDEAKSNRLTKRRLAHWLAQGNGEYAFEGKDGEVLQSCGIDYVYDENERNYPVDDTLKIRKWTDDEWHEPTVDYCLGGNKSELVENKD